MPKGREAPPAVTNHAETFAERLGQAAYSAQRDPRARPWEELRPQERAEWRAIGQAVLGAVMTKGQRRGSIEIASIYSSKTHQPLVEVRIDLSPTHLSPGKAREIALLLLEAADAAESDAALMGYAQSEMGLGLDMANASKLLAQLRQYREQQRGDKVETA